MAFIPAVNCAEVTFKYQQTSGDPAQNVVHVVNTAAWDNTTLQALADLCALWWASGYGGSNTMKECTFVGNNLLQVAVRDLTTESGLEATSIDGLPVSGSDSGPSTVLGITKAITLRTGEAGRSQRGRWFIVGMPGDSLATADTNTMDPAYINKAVSALNGLIENVNFADAAQEVCVLSRIHDGAPRVTGQMTPVLSAGFSNLLVDFQRRRAPGHNRHH